MCDSVWIHHHLRKDKATCVLHVWWISQGRGSHFFLGRGCQLVNYPAPLGERRLSESCKINSLSDLQSRSCPPPPLPPPCMMPAALAAVQLRKLALSRLSRYLLRKSKAQASLVVQWLGICLPMQGMQVRSLVWEDPTCLRAAKPSCPRACAPQQEKPLR